MIIEVKGITKSWYTNIRRQNNTIAPIHQIRLKKWLKSTNANSDKIKQQSTLKIHNHDKQQLFLDN